MSFRRTPGSRKKAPRAHECPNKFAQVSCSLSPFLSYPSLSLPSTLPPALPLPNCSPKVSRPDSGNTWPDGLVKLRLQQRLTCTQHCLYRMALTTSSCYFWSPSKQRSPLSQVSANEKLQTRRIRQRYALGRALRNYFSFASPRRA